MKIKKKLIHTLPLVTIASAAAIAVAGNITINANRNTNAADGISMTINGNLDFEITPEIGGTYAEKSIDVEVETSNTAGYTLYMASKDATNGAVKEGSEDGIVSVSEAVAKTNMPLNSWGYYVDGSNINPIPVADTPDAIKTTDAPSNDENKTTTVNVGVKVAPSLHSGDYENTLTFSAVPNTPCEGIFCLETMQEMTPAACDATTTPLPTATEVTFTTTSDNTKIPRTILRDVRDNKTYLVSKLADGKCWMSQNLALELDSTKALTSATTDLHTVSSWTPDESTKDNLDDLYYDLVDWRNSDHIVTKSFKPSGNYKYFRNGTTLAATPSTDDGTSEWESAGYYYNWVATTAKSQTEELENGWESNATARDSICPRGWRLPEVSGDSDSINDDRGGLAEAYGAYYDTLVGSPLGFIAAGNYYVGYVQSYSDGYDVSTDASSFETDSALYQTPELQNGYYNDIFALNAGRSYQYSYYLNAQNAYPIRCVAR